MAQLRGQTTQQVATTGSHCTPRLKRTKEEPRVGPLGRAKAMLDDAQWDLGPQEELRPRGAVAALEMLLGQRERITLFLSHPCQGCPLASTNSKPTGRRLLEV